MAQLKHLKVSFANEAEKQSFIDQSKAYYTKRDDGYYFEAEDVKTPAEREKNFKQNMKETLCVIGTIVGCLLIARFFVARFKHVPEPIIKTNTITVTGNTYNVTIDTRKIPAIGSLVYYYDSTISVQKGAKLNQVRIDADGITRYNICLQKEEDKTCLVDNPKYDPMVDNNEDSCLKMSEAPYTNCFDTSIIGNTEQELRDGICNK